MSERNTPLTSWHVAQGAKMAPFAGWNMPIQYSTGIIQEHLHTREKASIFDICHMGEFFISSKESGTNATEALGKAISTNLATLKVGGCRYGFLLTEDGGVIDDLVTYRLEEDSYMLVVNAACIDIDLQTLRQRLPEDIIIDNRSDSMGKIDLQGPLSNQVLSRVIPGPWTALPFFGFARGEYLGSSIIISRTGYTGELGYEIYSDSSIVPQIWENLLKDPEVIPAGLGARDTLRLECGLLLNGQDLDPQHTPAEAGFSALLGSTAPFVGKEKAMQTTHTLVALKISGKRSARHGQNLLTASGKQAGIITSASFAPSLGHCVALAYVEKELAEQDNFLADTGKVQLEAVRCTLPFYNGTARMKLQA